ncbi:MAG: hypothetical protein RLY87_2110 [Chloroflexota bacterium]|jgi:hypothetical protein
MITIGMATRHRPHQLAAWVAHIQTVSEWQHTPMIIVDQSREAFRIDLPAHIRYIHRPGSGLARARNLILDLAETSAVAFCDDDCRPAADWIVVASHLVRARPDIAVWFGATYPSGADAVLHVSATDTGSTVWASRPDGYRCQALRITPAPFESNRPCTILEHFGQGNNMVVRVAGMSRFEPLLGAGATGASGEDVAYALQMLHRGIPCAYDPRLRMVHDAWLPAPQSRRTGHGASCGMVAVHTWYALCGSAVARREAASRLHLLRARPTQSVMHSRRVSQPMEWYIRECAALIWGVLLGSWLAVRRGVPWRS